jgi:HK97 family phage prohead protease
VPSTPPKKRHSALPHITETRSLAIDPASVEVKKNSSTGILRGYALVHYREDDPSTQYRIPDSLSPYDSFTERMLTGCAAHVVTERQDVRMLVGHNSSGIPLARVGSGTLTLESDGHGLAFRAEIDRTTQQGHDVIQAVSRQDLTGASVGMVVRSDTWTDTGTEEIRAISKIDLVEFSLVALPANGREDGAAVAERSAVRFRRALARAQRGEKLTDVDLALFDISKPAKLSNEDAIERMRERVTLARQSRVRAQIRDLLAGDERRTERSRAVRDRLRRKGF